MDIKNLINKAIEARNFSYSPYSNFSVGAALLVKTGEIYTGCNIESASYSPTNCAERTAFFKAISEGHNEFLKIAIVGGKKDAKELTFLTPCGVCRQVMAEFCSKEFVIICAKTELEYKEFTLNELFPESFSKENLE